MPPSHRTLSLGRGLVITGVLAATAWLGADQAFATRKPAPTPPKDFKDANLKIDPKGKPVADDAVKAKPKPGAGADDLPAKPKPKPGLVDDAANAKAKAGQAGKTDQLIDDLLKKNGSSSGLADDVKAKAGESLGGAAAPSTPVTVQPSPKIADVVHAAWRNKLMKRQDSFSTARTNNTRKGKDTLEAVNKWVDDYVNQHIQRMDTLSAQIKAGYRLKPAGNGLSFGPSGSREVWGAKGGPESRGRPLADDAAKAREGQSRDSEALAPSRRKPNEDASSNSADKGKKPRDVEQVEAVAIPEVKATKELTKLNISAEQQKVLKQIADDAVREYERRLLTKMRQEAAEDSVLKELQSKTKTPSPSGTQPVPAP